MENSVVHPNAKIGANVKIHPFCYIAENVEIRELLCTVDGNFKLVSVQFSRSVVSDSL